MVFVIIHTPSPISKGLDHPVLLVYACLLLCFMLVLAFLVLGFATFYTLSGFVVVWLHPMPMRPCSDVTTWGCIAMMSGASCTPFPFSAPCDDMLTMLVCATCWLSLHLYTLAYMSMHESCVLMCRPCFNMMKLWTFHPNLHLSLTDTTFGLPSCFVCLFVCCLPAFSFVCESFLSYLPPLAMLAMSIIFIYLCPFHMRSVSFPSIACLLVFCLCLCMYACGARTHGARAQSPRRKQKGRGCEHADQAKQLQPVGLGFSFFPFGYVLF